jgi:hypothetical protein
MSCPSRPSGEGTLANSCDDPKKSIAEDKMEALRSLGRESKFKELMAIGLTDEALGKMDPFENDMNLRFDISFDVVPRNIGYKILGFFLNFNNMLQGVTDEYCKQLSDYAEAHP